MKTFVFDSDHAIRFGVHEAILLWQIAYWVEKNKANNKNLFAGKYWTYNSASAFQELFPFWSIKQIRRILQSLEEKGAIIKGRWNDDTYNKTYWYSLGEAYYQVETSKLPDEQMDVPNSELRCAQMGTSYTNILPYKDTNNIPPLYPPKEKNTSLNNKNTQPNPPMPRTPLPFPSQKFADAWSELCQMPKWRHKTERALKMALKQLGAVSEIDAIEAIEGAIAGEYQGIHPKNKHPQQPQEHVITDAKAIEKFLRH